MSSLHRYLSAERCVLLCVQAKPKFAQLLIPTVDSARYEYLLSLVLSVQKVHTLHFIGWCWKAGMHANTPGDVVTSPDSRILGPFAVD